MEGAATNAPPPLSPPPFSLRNRGYYGQVGQGGGYLFCSNIKFQTIPLGPLLP